VAPNDVTATVQFANLVPIHVTVAADPICRDKEVTAPPLLLQQVGRKRVRAGCTIVESQEYRDLGFPPFAPRLNGLNGRVPLVQFGEVFAEVSQPQRIHVSRPQSLDVEHIMQTETDCSHNKTLI